MANHSGIMDNDGRFQIIPTSRKIITPNGQNVLGVVGDCNSEQITFQCPRLIDGHEVAFCSRKSVVWKAANGKKGEHVINNITTEGDNILLVWTISEDITESSGIVEFSVHFKDIENGKIVYKWSTTPNRECVILDGGEKTASDGKTLGIYANGDYDVTDYSMAHVEVAAGDVNINLGTLNAYENGTYTAAEEGLDGFNSVEVDVQPNLQEKNATTNGEVTPDTGFDGLSKVRVNVQPQTETKTATPTKSTQTITPTTGKYLSKVTVNPIPSQYIIPSGNKSITTNGTNIDVKNFETASVNVQPSTQTKSATPTKEQQTITPDSGKYLSSVTVNPIPDSYTLASGNKHITANTIAGQTVDVKNFETATVNVVPKLQSKTATTNGEVKPDTGYDGLSSVDVQVSGGAPSLQNKEATPGTVQQTITPDNGYDGLSSVTVKPIPNDYVIPTGTRVFRNNTQAPEDVTNYKYVTVDVQPNVGTINKITANGTYNASAHGLDGFKSVEVEVKPNLTTETVTPSEQEQTIKTPNGFDGLSSVTVNPIPTEYVIPTGSTTITENGEDIPVAGLEKVTVAVPAKEEEEKTVTLDFSKGDQVVKPTSGKVFNMVTITMPATLLAENIKKGVTIAGVTGTFEGYHGKEGAIYIGAIRKQPSALLESDIKGFKSFEMASTLAVTYNPETIKGYLYFCLPEGKRITSIVYQATPDRERLDQEVFYEMEMTVDGQKYNVYKSTFVTNEYYDYKYIIVIGEVI